MYFLPVRRSLFLCFHQRDPAERCPQCNNARSSDGMPSETRLPSEFERLRRRGTWLLRVRYIKINTSPKYPPNDPFLDWHHRFAPILLLTLLTISSGIILAALAQTLIALCSALSQSPYLSILSNFLSGLLYDYSLVSLHILLINDVFFSSYFTNVNTGCKN